MTLRIHLYGNVCNNAYVIAKFLRRHGVDAHLFVERDFNFLPEHEDPELAQGYPDWIHVTGDLRLRRYGVFDRAFVRRLGDCDLVHVFYWGPIWARQTGRPFVFQTYGGDLSVMPFMTDSLHHRYLAHRQRQGIRAASEIFLTMPNNVYCTDAARQLNPRTRFLPIPTDADRFAPVPEEVTAPIRARYGRELLFFHPARQSWLTSHPRDRKGNDRLLRAFARFVRDGWDVLLLAAAYGPDVAASQQLVKELGIERHVAWIAPVRQHELIQLYGAADAVLDQFLLGDFGGCSREAWACGKPVFVYLESSADMLGKEPPAINVQTEDEIYRALSDYAKDPRALRELGTASRAWVLENLHTDALAPRYIDAYREILGASIAPVRSVGGA